MVRTGILLYDPRGQNDPRNRALDDQLDRLRVVRDIYYILRCIVELSLMLNSFFIKNFTK